MWSVGHRHNGWLMQGRVRGKKDGGGGEFAIAQQPGVL